MIKTIFLILLLYPLCSFSSQDSIDLLLKARGLQAVEKIEKLAKKNGDSKSKNLTKKEKCEWNLELAYYAFAHPDLTKTVRKPVYQNKSKEATAFILVIPEDDGTMGLQINFTYEKKTDSFPILNEISTLHEGWRIKISQQIPNKIWVNSPNCFYELNLKNPVESRSDTML